MIGKEFDFSQEAMELHQIERRFRLLDVDAIPSRTELDSQYPSVQLEQGYLITDGEEEIRIRSIARDNTYKLTKKANSGANRVWRERTISQTEFSEMWPETEGSRLQKTRYYIPIEGSQRIIELDFFEGDLKDFVLAEVKFGDVGEAERFVPPSWLQQALPVEVTDIAAFRNRNLSRYSSLSQHVSEFDPEPRPMPEIDLDKASVALNIMFDATRHIYTMYRKEERQIFGNSVGYGLQETDAEHSWHVSFLLDVLWQNRDSLGINFGDGFDIAGAMLQATTHDLAEIWAKDVDAVSKIKKLIDSKAVHEVEAAGLMVAAHPYLGSIAIRALEYAQKKTPEAQLISDIDKFAGILMIIFDGGKKWREQLGNTVSRDRHDKIIGQKIITPFGKAIWAELSRYFDKHPELFALDTVRPLISSMPMDKGN
jgi:adenylate cyclase